MQLNLVFISKIKFYILFLPSNSLIPIANSSLCYATNESESAKHEKNYKLLTKIYHI